MALKTSRSNPIVTSSDASTVITVAATGTVSTILNCDGYSPVALYTPSNFIACNLTFQVQKAILNKTGLYAQTDQTGTVVTVAAAPSQRIPLDPSIFNSVLFLQLTCSVAQSSGAVNIDFDLAPIFSSI